MFNHISFVRTICFAVSCLGCSLASAQSVEWTRQLGTTSYDVSRAVSADGLGNVFISGWTEGTLDETNAGHGQDAFVSKYDTDGNLAWTRQLGTREQLGTSTNDRSYGVSPDGLGNVFISGETWGALDGTNAGITDAFVSKYDAGGNLIWTRQLGTRDWDYSHGVSVDGLGNVFISGGTSGSLEGTNAGGFDAFVSKYDADGNLAWTRQLGTTEADSGQGVSADGMGNVFITGATTGTLDGSNAGGTDAFVSKYDAGGHLVWTRQLGTTDHDYGLNVSADGLGNVFISGKTKGGLDGANAGVKDAFVSKYDADGNLTWTRQLGSPASDESWGVSADGAGNVFISGSTYGALEGTNAGGFDAFVSKFDVDDGDLEWTRQLGTTDYEYGYGVSADGLGNVFISGCTTGALDGTNAGDYDIFVIKIHDVPEPGTLIMLATGALGLLRRRRGQKGLAGGMLSDPFPCGASALLTSSSNLSC